jgi:DNA-directed RNA polymerase subunit alpha
MKLNLLTEDEVRIIVAQEIAKLESRIINLLAQAPKQEVKSDISESDSIHVLMLSDRVKNTLANARINTVGELISHTEGQLIRYRSMGKKSFHEVKAKLASFGLRLSQPK